MVGLMGYAETKAERDALEQHDYDQWRAKQDADEFCRMKAALTLIAAGEIDEGGNVRNRSDAIQIAHEALAQ